MFAMMRNLENERGKRPCPEVAGSNPAPGTKIPAGSSMSEQKIRLRYIRLPNRTMEFLDELVFRSDQMIVGKSHVTSANSVIFDGRTVLAQGFPITYFQFLDKWFTIVKIRNLKGEHTGYYCDIVLPPRLLREWVEITDLFLDLWVSPDLRYRILDEDELEEALQQKWIDKEIYEKARMELQRLISKVENKRFPPYLVKDLERKLRL